MGTILIIDDSITMRKIIKAASAVLGFDTLEASDGAEGLEILRGNTSRVDLICLDVNMPEMNGYETLQTIKNDDDLKSIPVIMVTTESSRNEIVQAIRTGAKNYVCKPFTQEELIAKIADTLNS